MSAVQKLPDWITPEEYLESEPASEVRREYVLGHVYAMAGASDDHSRITLNICSELRERLRGKRCEPFSTDMKIRIRHANDTFYYPDVTVACDPTDNAKYFRERPSVIFEVISPDTERTDRREKAYAYWRIPSVEMYLLVEQDQQRITVLRRAESDWKAETLEGPSAVVKLECIGVEIPFERIYERTAIAASDARNEARKPSTP